MGCLFLNMGGYVFILQQRQQALKKEMMLRIHSGCDLESVETFEFALVDGRPVDPAFRWVEDEEFSYSGKMYDVVRKYETNGKLRLQCIEDSKEEALIAQLLKLHEKQDGKTAKGRSIVQLLITSLYIQTETQQADPVQAVLLSHQEHYLSWFKPIPRDVIVPPPRA
jgi:hypothetical protein